MSLSTLHPGFHFHPTDNELVLYYLKSKVTGRPFYSEAISEVELYKFAPWELPDKSCLHGNDLMWYFFCISEKKYSNGSRKNRATQNGFWKTTGRDKPIIYNSRTVAMRKTLVFHLGKTQTTRTDWVMHEYRLEDSKLADAGINQDAYVVCKIFKKSGKGPKIGERYEPLFMENDWEDIEINNSLLSPPAEEGPPISYDDQEPRLRPIDHPDNNKDDSGVFNPFPQDNSLLSPPAVEGQPISYNDQEPGLWPIDHPDNNKDDSGVFNPFPLENSLLSPPAVEGQPISYDNQDPGLWFIDHPDNNEDVYRVFNPFPLDEHSNLPALNPAYPPDYESFHLDILGEDFLEFRDLGTPLDYEAEDLTEEFLVPASEILERRGREKD